MIMALSFRDKQILLYEGGYIDLDYLDTAGINALNNLKEDFLEAAKTMDKEIEAGNFITVDRQFVMNNVGMFRGIHEDGKQVYVFNFEFHDSQSFDETNDVSLVFFLDTPAQHLNRLIGVGLEPLKSVTHQYYDDWQFVPSLKDWGNPVLNWTPQQLIQMIEKFARS
jgi:hypothetical protein